MRKLHVLFGILCYTSMVSFFNKNFFALARTKNGKTGFTLVEVLVAIAVITIIGFLPISVVSDHLIQNALTKNRVAAGLLVQEIVEYVRYTRDSDLLDPDGGDWFDTLADPQSTNMFAPCVVSAADWVLEDRETYLKNYCTVECFAVRDDPNPNRGLVTDKTMQGECGTPAPNDGMYNGAVAGIAPPARTRGKRTDTCDGNGAKANNAFTTTLNTIIARDDDEVQYVVVVPCISWSDKTDTVRRVETQEAMFEWIQRKK